MSTRVDVTTAKGISVTQLRVDEHPYVRSVRLSKLPADVSMKTWFAKALAAASASAELPPNVKSDILSQLLNRVTQEPSTKLTS